MFEIKETRIATRLFGTRLNTSTNCLDINAALVIYCFKPTVETLCNKPCIPIVIQLCMQLLHIAINNGHFPN